MSWHRDIVDPAHHLVGVSCATVRVCVAVDDAGNLLTSTQPENPSAAWTSGNLEGPDAFIGVTCPSAGLCVAATSTDVLVSKNPALGANGWTILHNIDGAVGPECGKYGGNSGCPVAMALLSCASSSLCMAVDDYGGTLVGDPSSGSWSSHSGPGTEVGGLACIPQGTACLTECVIGAGYGGPDCPGNTYAGSLLCAGTGGCFMLTADQFYGLWCPRHSFCAASDASGHLFASGDPTGGVPAWKRVYSAKAQSAPSGLACPTIALCVGVDTTGHVLLGAPLPSISQTGALVASALAHAAAPSVPRVLHHRYIYDLAVPTAGTITVRWTTASRRGSTLEIAKGARTVQASAATSVAMHLTSRGRGLLQSSMPLRAKVTVTVTGGTPQPITITRTLTFRAT